MRLETAITLVEIMTYWADQVQALESPMPPALLALDAKVTSMAEIRSRVSTRLRLIRGGAV
ncbi:hypothetical protein D3874_03200 [Oleomonas cavernae]|uniref:Uncharacterized protein n=2 Tax=Oleomonas cavernae TaxID=2320859 RepID=A0A418WUC0_9PROT|nr:hypothetical protein D3874_03200 [Oleomonas cavernae]